jgi:hypothetical protein
MGLHLSKTYDDVANTITLASTLTNVDNTSDANKPISTATSTALALKAPLASPDLTGTPTAPTAISTVNTTQIATTAFVQTAVSNLVNSAPEALNTLKELSDALGSDANFATTTATALGTKITASSTDTLTNKSINLTSNTFTGTKAQFNLAISDADFVTLDGSETLTNKTITLPLGLVKSDVGLGNVDNTSDSAKPVSTLTQAAIDALSSTVNQNLADKSNNLISSFVTTQTSYTLGITDIYKRIEFDSATAVTVIIPADLTTNLPIGSSLELLQSNTGKITVQAAGVEVSIYGPDNQFKSRVRWSSIFLEKRGANSWLITGDTEA